MTSWIKILKAGILSAALLLAGLGAGPAKAAGLLTPTGRGDPELDLRDHAVTVVVEDGYAVTTVEQVFHNPHGRDLEALYSFPVPEKGAVAEFTYWIDGKPVTGEVMAKDKARQVYESEKTAGREAGLAEQDSHKTFDVKVWPVRAGKDVRIRMTYIQPAHVDTGFGRYVYPLEEGGVDEQRLSFWTANETVTGSFSFDLLLRSDVPVDAVLLPAHPNAVVTKTPEGYWQVHIGAGGGQAAEEGAAAPSTAPVYNLDTDIVVNWRLVDGLPGSVDLAAHKPDAGGKGTFMMVVTPGADLKTITRGRDWVFVLDKSGSMQSKFATLAEGVSRALHKLRPEDRFRVVVFDTGARELTHGFRPATRENIDQAHQMLGGITPDNGTNLYAGLELGLRHLDADRSSGLVLVTDGVANVGKTETKDFVGLVERSDVRLFTVVMGNSANRPLLEPMAKVSGGTAVSVSNSDDIVGAVLNAVGKLGYEALHDVRVDIDGVRVKDIRPKAIGSLYRGQQLVLFGHYWKGGEADVAIKARISGQEKVYRTRFAFPETATRNPEIERLWAYAAIEGMMHEMALYGEEADRRQGVEDLAVEYGLVTPYTSMVVVRDEVFESLQIKRTNRNRVAVERKAQQQRAQAPVVKRRVDTAKPAFTSPRPTHRSSGGGGSGAMGPLDLALLGMAAAVIIVLRRRRAA